MAILDSKARRIIPVKSNEATCRDERLRQQAKREWVKENILEHLRSKDDGMIINFKLK